jgi:toxin ParE1/3/4
MIWNVFYTEDAAQDLRNIQDYISDILLEPATATKLINQILDAGDSLDKMPFRYPLFPNEPWRTKGLRVLTAGNYLVLYLPIQSQDAVSIIRIMYQTV